MEPFKEQEARDGRRTRLGMLAVLAGALAILLAMTVLSLQVPYIDVEQAVPVAEEGPAAVAIHDSRSAR